MKLFYIIMAIIVVALSAADARAATVWTTAGFEGADEGTLVPPASNVNASLTPDMMRNFRYAVRHRASAEHWWGDQDTSDEDNGLHLLGSARCFMANAKPTVLYNGATDYDGSDGTGTGTLSDTASRVTGATARDDVGDGRCWIDLDGADGIAGNADDNQRWIYIGDVGWVEDSAGGGISPVAQNLIYNGSFEVTDGDGDSSATVIPLGWVAKSGPATYTYTATDPVEGDGLAVVIAGAATANSGMQQQIAGLKPATDYLVVARVKATSGDTCFVDTSGAVVTEMTAVEVTATSFTTASGTFTTHATALNTVNIRIFAETAGDICTVDSVAVYEKKSEPIPQAGIVVFEDTASDSAGTGCDNSWSGTCADLVTVVVDPPGPGYVAHVIGVASLDVGGFSKCAVRIHDGTNTIALGGMGGDDSLNSTLHLQAFTATPLVPGTAITYTLDVLEDNNTCATDTTTGSGSVETLHSLQVILIPTR